MYEDIKNFCLRLLKISPEPSDYHAEAANEQVFRPAPAFFAYHLFVWFYQSLGGVLSLAILIVPMLIGVLNSLEVRWQMPIVMLLLLLAALTALIYAGSAFIHVWLDYELRRYRISRSGIKVREGAISILETTMSIANIQNVSIEQGPIQRVLGISDILIQSAGGGGGVAQAAKGLPSPDYHTVRFAGVRDAETIANVLREYLKIYQDSGLGHTEDKSSPPAMTDKDLNMIDILKGMRDEAVLMRKSLENAQ